MVYPWGLLKVLFAQFRSAGWQPYTEVTTPYGYGSDWYARSYFGCNCTSGAV